MSPTGLSGNGLGQKEAFSREGEGGGEGSRSGQSAALRRELERDCGRCKPRLLTGRGW